MKLKFVCIKNLNTFIWEFIRKCKVLRHFSIFIYNTIILWYYLNNFVFFLGAENAAAEAGVKESTDFLTRRYDEFRNRGYNRDHDDDDDDDNDDDDDDDRDYGRYNEDDDEEEDDKMSAVAEEKGDSGRTTLFC